VKRLVLLCAVLLLCLGACAGGGSSGSGRGGVQKQPLDYWYTDDWKPGQQGDVDREELRTHKEE
jgi:hypothetical protein